MSVFQVKSVLSALSLSCICQVNVLTSCYVLTHISCIFSDEVWLNINTLKVLKVFQVHSGSTGLLTKANNSVILSWELVYMLMLLQIQFIVRSMLPWGIENRRSTACHTEQTSSFGPPPLPFSPCLCHTVSLSLPSHPSIFPYHPLAPFCNFMLDLFFHIFHHAANLSTPVTFYKSASK